MLRDLSAQGKPVNIQARSTRWRCRNHQCDRRIFAERLPRLATPFARRTVRLTGIIELFGHGAGGRPSERLLARLGMPREIILRHRLPHFSHVFSGESYAAGYFNYIWADVLSADAAEAFLSSFIDTGKRLLTRLDSIRAVEMASNFPAA